jgi:hypothetical protein
VEAAEDEGKRRQRAERFGVDYQPRDETGLMDVGERLGALCWVGGWVTWGWWGALLGGVAGWWVAGHQTKGSCSSTKQPMLRLGTLRARWLCCRPSLLRRPI